MSLRPVEQATAAPNGSRLTQLLALGQAQTGVHLCDQADILREALDKSSKVVAPKPNDPAFKSYDPYKTYWTKVLERVAELEQSELGKKSSCQKELAKTRELAEKILKTFG